MKRKEKQSHDNSKNKNEETSKDISIRLKVEEQDSEMSVNYFWKNISSIDRKKFFSKMDSLISLFKKFNGKYGEEDVEIVVEENNGKTKVKSKMGDSKTEFFINSTKEKEVLSEISKTTGISTNKLDNFLEF